MRPVALHNEILVVYQDVTRVHHYSEALFSKERNNPYIMVKMVNGRVKFRLHFSEVGKLLQWDRYTYLMVKDTFASHVEEGKYHEIRVLDGSYDCKIMERLIKGIKVKEKVDTETPSGL